MSPVIHEWLNLLVRWVHVIAAIMWIGDSFLFMWLDSSLSAPTKKREGDVAGELWMTHSGGFYEVIKRRSLLPEELPPRLFWFKWESYTTWLSGALLLIIVYHLNGAALLVDGQVAALSPAHAVALSLLLLVVGYGLYELLWQTPLRAAPYAFLGVGFALVVATAYGLTQLFSARGAFLQMGAMLGTIMAANVFFRIIPAQKHMLAMTRAGQPVDTRYGQRAKGRSIHNHYLTLPVLFTMLSNHFPAVYGHAQPWMVLGLLFAFGMGLKYVMNHRGRTSPLVWGVTAGALGWVVFLTLPADAFKAAPNPYQNEPPVSYATVHTIIEARCVSCHAAKPQSPMYPAPPLGVVLERPEQVQAMASRIYVRSVLSHSMPLGNLTGMTDEERRLLGAWYAQGADLQAPGPSVLGATPAGEMDAGGLPTSTAEGYYQSLCVSCHGAAGDGAGPAGVALDPKPRDFTDPTWHRAVTDERLAKVIVEGGAAHGQSPLMPPNPQLADQPELLQGLVRVVRQFEKKP